MKTTGIVYLIFWVLIAAPLIGFNLKKLWIKQPGEPRRFLWRRFAVLATVFVLATAFLFAAWRVTLKVRYEIAAERYVYAEVACLQNDPAARKELAALRTAAFAEKEPALQTGSAPTVRFQIGDQITAKYLARGKLEEARPGEEEATVCTFCLLEIDGKQSYWVLRLIRQEDGGWLTDGFSPATEEQVDANRKNLANAETAVWYTP